MNGMHFPETVRHLSVNRPMGPDPRCFLCKDQWSQSRRRSARDHDADGMRGDPVRIYRIGVVLVDYARGHILDPEDRSSQGFDGGDRRGCSRVMKSVPARGISLRLQAGYSRVPVHNRGKACYRSHQLMYTSRCRGHSAGGRTDRIHRILPVLIQLDPRGLASPEMAVVIQRLRSCR